MHFSDKNSTNRLVLDRELDEFLIDREAQNLTANTLRWYRHSLSIFHEFIIDAGVAQAVEITPATLRRFLIHLSGRGHSDGGIVNIYGAVKAFLKWYEAEYEPEDWTNPLVKVKSPKRTKEILPPLATDDFMALVRACNNKTFTGARDQATLLMLLDSGVRKQELCDLNVGNIDLQSGDVLIQSGKGRQSLAFQLVQKVLQLLLCRIFFDFKPMNSVFHPILLGPIQTLLS